MTGTPKTLDEAIRNALCLTPLNRIEETAYHVMKDFLAQKFGVAMLQHPEAEEVLMNLYETIVRRAP